MVTPSGVAAGCKCWCEMQIPEWIGHLRPILYTRTLLFPILPLQPVAFVARADSIVVTGVRRHHSGAWNVHHIRLSNDFQWPPRFVYGNSKVGIQWDLVVALGGTVPEANIGDPLLTQLVIVTNSKKKENQTRWITGRT